MSSHPDPKSNLRTLALGAIGVVYGDIGTSPLYTLKEVFSGPHPMSVEPGNVIGVLSLIFWALFIVVSLKYVIFVMRADNQGEGGIMALLALVDHATVKQRPVLNRFLLLLGIFGAALFYGDGMITPAISVLSAVEGLDVAAPALAHWVDPIAVVVLIALFGIQRWGTARVGRLFGPVMVVWFVVLAGLGLSSIAQTPEVLWSFDPRHGLDFFLQHKIGGFLALGAVVLEVTGAEALYADMGHFGKYPIRLAWFCFVLPALLLNYFGQGALLLREPAAVQNPFYLLAPGWALYPMIGLATAATIIASQAVISGAFSITRQAIQLGYLPRMSILHTSEHEAGQIYIPFINWMLLLGVLALVLGFRSSSNLASAYGIAVTGTMAIDTLLGFIVAWLLWRWSLILIVPGLLVFLSVDLAFFSANSLKLLHGGWFPLVIGIAVFTLLATWKKGRLLLRQRLQLGALSPKFFVDSLIHSRSTLRVPGTAVFLNTHPDIVPHALLHNMAHNKVLHERVIFLTVVTEDIPYVQPEDRIKVEKLDQGFFRVLLDYGFKETPDIPEEFYRQHPQACGEAFSLLDTSFFLSRETLIAQEGPDMALWRKKLFVWMASNAQSAMSFFKLPTNRVIELGTQVRV